MNISTNPPTVSDTKRAFFNSYRKIIPSVYNAQVQDLLVKQHLYRYNAKYEYSNLSALGVITTLDNVLESFPYDDRIKITDAFIGSLGEDPDVYRSDVEKMKAVATTCKLSFDDMTKVLDKRMYNMFVAIGIFKFLQVQGIYDVNSVVSLTASLGFDPEVVHRDLTAFYKILNHLESSRKLANDIKEEASKKRAL